MIEFNDTPNPNAKKINIQHKYEISIYLNLENVKEDVQLTKLLGHPNIKGIFTGPGFLTVLKKEDGDWTSIMKDLEINTDSI